MRWAALGLLVVLAAPAPAAAQRPALQLVAHPAHPLAGATVEITLEAPGAPSRVEWDLTGDYKVDQTTQLPVVTHSFRAGLHAVRAIAYTANGRRFGAELKLAVRRARLPKLRLRPRGQGLRATVSGLPARATVRWTIRRSGHKAKGAASVGRSRTFKGSGSGALVTAAAANAQGEYPAVASRSGDTVRVSDLRPGAGQSVLVGGRGAGVIDFGDGTQLQFNDNLVAHAYGTAGRYTASIGDASIGILVDSVATSRFGCSRIDGFPRASAWLCPTDAAYAGCSVKLRAANPDYERCELDGSPLDDAELISGSPVISSCTDDPALGDGGRRCTDHERYLDCRAYAVGNVHKAGFPISYCAEGDEPVALHFDRAAALTVAGPDAEVTDSGAVTHVFDHVPHPAPDPNCDEQVAQQFGESCARECQEEYWTWEAPPADTSIPVIEQHPCGQPDTAHHTLLELGNADDIAVAECKVLLEETPEADSIDYDAWSWFKITPHFVVNHPLTKSSHSTEFDFWALSYSHESSASWSDHSDVIDGDAVRINVPLRVSCTRG